MKTLKSSLKFSVVEITPKDAEVLLSKYLHNRPISRDNINKYAIQMSDLSELLKVNQRMTLSKRYLVRFT